MTTVARLHKLLGELITEGYGRTPVCINKETFTNPMEADGANILPVVGLDGPTFVCKMGDDGETLYTKTGAERGTFYVILRGAPKESDS